MTRLAAVPLVAAWCIAAAFLGAVVAWNAPAAFGLLAAGVWIANAHRPGWLIALTGVTLPMTPVFVVPIAGAVAPVADLLAVAAMLALVLSGSLGLVVSIRAARPVLAIGAVYVAAAWWVTRGNVDGLEGWITLLQRVELLLLWPVFGAALWLSGRLALFLKAFLVGCALVAVPWYFSPGADYVLGMQKNASAGYLACAVIIVLLWTALATPRRLLLLGLYAGALIFTGSRGSILGGVAGCAVALLFVTNWRRIIGLALAGAAAAAAALAVMPAEARDRILSRSATGRTNIEIRGIFRRDALLQWQANPDGVGVGLYRQFLPELQAVETFDPHNPWVLALAEGGWLLFGAFTFFTAGLLLLAFTAARRVPGVGHLALCVQVSILAHVYFDVYWVRGTPVPGLLLVGVAAAALLATREGSGGAAGGSVAPVSDGIDNVSERSAVGKVSPNAR